MQLHDELPIRCALCQRSVHEFTASLEGWHYWSDGAGELIPFCPDCSRPELASALLERAKRSRAGRTPPRVR